MRRSGLKYEHVLSFAIEHPWAITASMRQTIAGILASRMAGEDADESEIAAALVARDNRQQQAASGSSGVYVIPVYGVLSPRMNLLSEMSGGATFEGLTAQLHEAASRPDARAIVFDVDSPGGNVAGATEFAREVMKIRAKLPVIAVAQHSMASAAYWVMSGATEIVASPSAMVGSIGVYAMHRDISEALAKLGVKVKVFSAGKYKAEGADGGPLTEEAETHINGLVDASYQRFVGDVAKGRGVSADKIRHGYGEGRSLNAEQALAAGLIDRIATMSETLARYLTASPVAGARASADLAATSQEPGTPATDQEPQSSDLVAFEQRLLTLERVSL